MQVERLERHLAHEVDALHDHPRIPEEQDVKTGDHDVVGVMATDQRGFVGPAERRERPQRRGEPGVEDVFVASHRLAAGEGFRLFLGFGDVDRAVLSIPRRYPVAPP